MQTPLFSIGLQHITPGALESLTTAHGTINDGLDAARQMVCRHAGGDWRDMDEHDLHANHEAIETGARVFSAYTVRGVRYWVITDADREYTVVMLPSEY